MTTRVTKQSTAVVLGPEIVIKPIRLAEENLKIDIPSFAVEITIQSSKVSANLTNYPLVITERDLPSTFWSYATTSNIQFKASGGGSDLTTEIAWVDIANESFRGHVLVPSISSSTDTVIEMHWGVAQTTTGSVFTMYEVVIPFKLTGSGDLTNYGTDVQTITVNGSPSFDRFTGMQLAGSNERIETTLASTINEYYMSAYCRQTNTTQKTILSVHSTSTVRSNLTVDDGNHVAMWDNTNSWVDTSPLEDPGTTNYFTHAGRIIDATERSVWYNGGSEGVDSTVSTIGNMDNIFVGTAANSLEDWVGFVTEARVTTDVTFSDSWVAFEHSNYENTSDYTITEL